MDRTRPNRLRFESTVLSGERWIRTFDGQMAWTINPFGQGAGASESSLAEAEMLRREAVFGGTLLSADPASMRLEGEEDVDGELCYKIVVQQGEVEETWFLSKETYLEFSRLSLIEDFGRPLSGTTYFMDFRPVEGLMLAHHVEQEFGIRHRAYLVESVEINPKFPEGHFDFPVTEAMQAVQKLAGTFAVEVEFPTRPGAPWAKGEGEEAVVEAGFRGHRLVSDLRLVIRGQPLDLRWTLSYDALGELYRMTVFDSGGFQETLLQGSFQEGILSLTNLETEGPKAPGAAPPVRRITLSEIGDDGFVMTQADSPDEGTTWTDGLRLTFRRLGKGDG